jgi:hypothetical protein
MTVRIMTLDISIKCHMLSVAIFIAMLSVVMLNVVMMRVVAPKRKTVLGPIL